MPEEGGGAGVLGCPGCPKEDDRGDRRVGGQYGQQEKWKVRAGERKGRWDLPLDGDVSAFGGLSLWKAKSRVRLISFLAYY